MITEYHSILAFCHITKNAGTSVVKLLREYFGTSHLDVYSKSRIYDSECLRRDLKHFPKTRSIAGHHLNPSIDFESSSPDLWWFAFLRNPVKRFLSHYQHVVEKTNIDISLEQWVNREDYWNKQTKMICGEGNAEKAIQIIRDRMAFVGTVERFQESLQCIEKLAGIPGFSNQKSPQANRARSNELQNKIACKSEQYHAVLAQANTEDEKLYRFVADVYLPEMLDMIEDNDLNKAHSSGSMEKPHRPESSLMIGFLQRNLRYRFISGYWKEKFWKRFKTIFSKFQRPSI